MVLRVQSSSAKFGVEAESDLRVQSASAKFGVEATGDLRVQAVSVKWAVGTVKIERIVRIIPPIPMQIICSCNPVCCFTYG